jgi:hypothetical protein
MTVYEMGPMNPAKTKEMITPRQAWAKLVAVVCLTEAQIPRIMRNMTLIAVPHR